MKVLKHELAKAISKLKSLVVKNDQMPALSCVLVSDGYLIASNTEITLKVKLEGSEGTQLLIPMRAFDLINNLPEGYVEITANSSNVVTIQMEKIKNTYQSFNPEDFGFNKPTPPWEGAIKLPGMQLMNTLSSVMWAAADKTMDKMSCIYLESEGDRMNFVGLDGHVLAWNWIQHTVSEPLKLLIPKATVRKIVSMGILDDVYLTHDKASAIFMTDEYVLYTRLMEGDYYKYRKFFESGDGKKATVETKMLLSAMTRAKACVVDNKPVIYTLEGDSMKLEISDGNARYDEDLALHNEFEGTLRIGFDSRLVLETVKAYGGEKIDISFTGMKAPAIVEDEQTTHLKTMLLPVAISA